MKTNKETLIIGIKSGKSFAGYFSILSDLLNPTIFTSQIKEIQVSDKVHSMLLEFVNEKSNMYFTRIKHFFNIPVIINESFEPDIWEIHFENYIERKQVNDAN